MHLIKLNPSNYLDNHQLQCDLNDHYEEEPSIKFDFPSSSYFANAMLSLTKTDSFI